MYSCSILFNSCVIFLCRDIQHFKSNLSVDGHLSCFYFLLWIMLIWALGNSFLFEHLFSIFLGIYLRVELLSHMETLSLTFQRIANLFSKLLHHFKIPLAMYEDFNFSTFLSTLICPALAILVVVKRYLIVILLLFS